MPDRALPLDEYLKSLSLLKPFRELTAAEEKVARLIARGWSYKQLGKRLRMSPRTVQHHVNTIAGLLPNPEQLAARQLVQVWSGSAAWERIMREKSKRPAA
jgi:FixJ family two-component response regulator